MEIKYIDFSIFDKALSKETVTHYGESLISFIVHPGEIGVIGFVQPMFSLKSDNGTYTKPMRVSQSDYDKKDGIFL